MKETPGDTFRRMAAGEELTPEEIAKVRDFIRIMDGIAWDLEGIIAAIKGSGLVFIPGKILAGERNVSLDKYGINLTEGDGYIRFVDATGTRKGYINETSTTGTITIAPETVGGTGANVSVLLPLEGEFYVYARLEDASQPSFSWGEDTTANRTLLRALGGASGFRALLGDDIKLYSNIAGETTVFNDDGYDVNFRIEGDTVTDVFSVDAGEDAVILHSVKTTTGDRTGQEGMLVYNTFDNNIKMYADGAWRTLASW